MDLISIIVPIYKVENYLKSCLDSIVLQTYKNLEIILVDDGSPDKCPEICDEYAKIDSRIKVVHKKNGGLSDARNFGLSIASGNYIMFVDSDDAIEHDMCEILMGVAQKFNSDIVMSAFKKVHKLECKNKKKTIKSNNILVVDGRDEVFDLLFNNKIPLIMLAWGKLYKKDIFKNIEFPVGRIHEDEFTIHKLLNNCRKFVYINIPLYHYLYRNTSITGGKFNIKRLDQLVAKKERLEFVLEKRSDFAEKAKYQYLKSLILYYYKCKWAKFDNEICNNILEEINKVSSCSKKYLLTKLFKKYPAFLGLILKLRYRNK